LLWRTEHQQSEKAFVGAIDIYKELVAKTQGVSGYRFQLARSYNNLANLFRESGKKEETEKNYGQALKLLKQLAVDFPKVPLYRQELAGVYLNLGIFHDRANHPADADKAYQQALKLRQKVAEESPNNPHYQHPPAHPHVNLGAMLRERKSFVQASDHYRQAVSLLEKIAVPNSRPAYQSDLAIALNNQARLLGQQAQKLAPLAGLELVLQTAAGNTWGGASLWWQREDLLLQARMCLKRAVWCQRAALKADPNNVQYPRLLNEHYHDLVLVQL